MGGHAGDIGEFVKGLHPQGNIYNYKGNMTVGVLPCDHVLGEMMTWDLEHMIDVKHFDVDLER